MVFVFFWLRAESAPKPIVSKKPMEFDDFQSWFRRPRDRSSARSVSKTCSKKRLPEEKKTRIFFFFFVFGLPAPRIKKMLPKWPPKSSRRGSWGPRGSPKSINFSPPAGPGGAPSHVWDSGGPPRASRGGPRRAKEPSGPPREAPGQTCAKSVVLSSFPALDPLNGCIWLGVLNLYIGQKGVLHTVVCRTPFWPMLKLRTPSQMQPFRGSSTGKLDSTTLLG